MPSRRGCSTRFDASRASPSRSLVRRSARLLKLDEQAHVLLRTVHHIAADGWAAGVFNRELMTIYGAYRDGREHPLPPLPLQYADFALWQDQWLESGALETGLGVLARPARWRARASRAADRHASSRDPDVRGRAVRHRAVRRPDRRRQAGHTRTRHDGLHDDARRPGGAARPLHRAGRYRLRHSDCESSGRTARRADRLLRQYPGAAIADTAWR